MSPSQAPPRLLLRKWRHSHEEDSDQERVFRPAEHAFPPSRGRRDLEFKADGTLVDTGPGASDRRQVAERSFRVRSNKKLQFFANSAEKPSETWHIQELSAERLVLKKATQAG